jgi:hypothetical protein
MGVLDIARQILGLTLDTLRRIAVRILGEAAVERIEFFLGYAAELITGGWGALFDRIKQDLSGLYESVMGQITTFLLERVVKAGIIWLASLINPAGALVKVVLLIWDAIMWLKDNLARMIAIVQTVVQGMIDIANGNTEPASKAIEETLARLMTPAIDLIARLIGLGNVAERVQAIFRAIHQRIEDAVVRLIQSVLARFTGGRGAAPGATAPEGASDAMTPVPFSGGGESHTLYAVEQGQDVIPFMRSTPQPVETWLKGLQTRPGVKAQLQRATPGGTEDAVSDAAVTAKLAELAPLVTRALSKEAVMDTAGDQNNDDLLKAKAQDTAAALTEILKALGVSTMGEFKLDFAPQIAALEPSFQVHLNSETSQRIKSDPAKAAAFDGLTWARVPAALGADPSLLTNAWKQPFHAGGLLREHKGFMAVFFAQVAARSAALATADPSLAPATDYASNTKTQDAFWDHFLWARQAGAVDQPMLDHMLGSGSRAFAGYMAALDAHIDAAVTRHATSGLAKKPDIALKDTIKAAAFRPGGLFSTDAFRSLTLPFYAKQDANGQGVGAADGPHPLTWFLQETGGSPRAQENREHTADRVRDADPGNHEWILASQANLAIEATLRQLTQPNTAYEGIANFIQFMHLVRTPTSHLVFSPEYSEPKYSRPVNYLTAEHYAQVARRKTPLSKAEVDGLYPSAPNRGTMMPTIQAHSGGLKVLTLDESGGGIEQTESSASSSTWHIALRSTVKDVLTKQLPLDHRDMRALGDSILGYFDETIFNKTSDTSRLLRNSTGYGLYEFTGAGAATTLEFGEIVRIAIARQEQSRKDLEDKINAVIKS